MKKLLIINAKIVNDGQIESKDVLVKNGRFEKIANQIGSDEADEVIDAKGKYLFPGLIDDQVHFREPGLTHKANIFTESRAAVAGGVTSFMEMPNTVPNALTQELLEDKYQIAAKNSLANYSFFMGASNDNIEEVLKTNPKNVCGVKVFMGSSTGNMLVDNEQTLNNIFSKVPMLIATHCEDEATIRANTEKYQSQYGEEVPIEMHPKIRSEEACYLSSSLAVQLAKQHGSRLHVLHISTAKELSLFDNSIPLEQKKITAEACIHHLWFSEEDYHEKGTFIKWNPAVKTAHDREEIMKAVLDGRIDVIATDHAPHTFAEKQNSYFKAPSGGPLVQHSLLALLDFYHQGKISLEQIAQKAAHNPAILFHVKERGFIRESYHADFVLVDLERNYTVSKENILSKCGWSPFEGHSFQSTIDSTYVNGRLVYNKEGILEGESGERLWFEQS
ncbi:dihydroorotase [Marivirga sp. S37H4]|uniref:Dihydroorotase n=1 Tax=Marivirga aurantiaca TaxID=2802615 RepID=A0A935CCA0_9BACT|nr:dihydroorotase [Marivirga aurantiaca]MBK6267357.1 dihydroorotase [Marivirga aurantiaca]